MRWFLVLFLSCYGLAHSYLLLRIRLAFPRQPEVLVGAICWCLLMLLAPIATRLLEREEMVTAATVVAWVGYCWMGFLFLYLALAATLELLRLLQWLAHFVLPVRQLPVLFAPLPFLCCCLAVALLLTLYAWFEAGQLRVERLVVRTPKLAAGTGPIRIVQLSDLHIGLIVGPSQVARVVEEVRRQQPDLLVATGDMVDGHIRHFDGVSQMFRQLSPRLGMLAVPGNHEYYAGAAASRRFLEQAGFQVLQDQTVVLGNQLRVVGIDDAAAVRFGNRSAGDEGRLVASLPQGGFTLVLKHRPVVPPALQGHSDLQLSGHVHKGQLFPFNLLTWLAFPVRAGSNPLAGGGLLYVSRGTGTWGPPLRLFAPPELTVIDLLPSE